MNRITKEDAKKLVVDHRMAISNGCHERALKILEDIYPKIRKEAKAGGESYTHYFHSYFERSLHMDTMVLVMQDLKENGFSASHGEYKGDYQDPPNKGDWQVTVSWK